MGVSKLEAAINKAEKYNNGPDYVPIEWTELLAGVGNMAYIDALNGNLYRKSSKGEIVKVMVKGR